MCAGGKLKVSTVGLDTTAADSMSPTGLREPLQIHTGWLDSFHLRFKLLTSIEEYSQHGGNNLENILPNLIVLGIP